MAAPTANGAAPFCLQRLRQLLQSQIKEYKNYHTVLSNLELISAAAGRCTAELLVGRAHVNAAGTLHGGFSATLIDCVSTYALLTERNVRSASVDLNLSFLGPAKEGDRITIEATTLRLGKSLAYLTADIRKGGKLIVTGQHTKFVQPDLDYFGKKVV